MVKSAEKAEKAEKSADKKIKKVKKEKTPKKAAEDAGEPLVVSAAETAAAPKKALLIPIAKPLADEKLSKKVLKLAKKATKRKQIKRGVKEVVKAIRKKFTGICVIAGDISPIDVITHLPVLCEENDIPYIYVPSKEELGAAGLTKRPTSCMLLLPKPPKGGAEGDDGKEFAESFADVHRRVKAVQPSVF